MNIREGALIPPEMRKLMSNAVLPGGGRETALKSYLFLNSKTANENFS